MKHDLKVLFEKSRPKNLAQDMIIFDEGDNVDRIYYISSGYIKVYTQVGRGIQRIAFIYRPGEVFPLTTYLSSNNTARFIYECMTPVTLRTLSSKKFDKKVRGNLEVGEQIIQYTRTMDRQFLEQVHDLVTVRDGHSKTIKALMFLVERAGSGNGQVRINLPLDAKVLASICGLSREETSRHLNRLIKKGIIAKSQDFVIDKAKLNAMYQKSKPINTFM